MAATANTKTDRHNARTVAPLTLTEPGILRPRKVFINLKTSGRDALDSASCKPVPSSEYHRRKRLQRLERQLNQDTAPKGNIAPAAALAG